jgi:hypothetical protein
MNAIDIRQRTGNQFRPISAWSSPPHQSPVRAPP